MKNLLKHMLMSVVVGACLVGTAHSQWVAEMNDTPVDLGQWGNRVGPTGGGPGTINALGQVLGTDRQDNIGGNRNRARFVDAFSNPVTSVFMQPLAGSDSSQATGTGATINVGSLTDDGARAIGISFDQSNAVVSLM